ncbi:hypothetical protein BD289DRAFT_432690 [Coniella lustricola]|uniref:RNase P subunit p30-domain-containing protein n=1 Tax=Coniella lustricola TaxID=2025994 RepID=A0A2T3A9C4_9PEZI|nr:hypothetical protein BD289DRAFT_432690 [Coniella lustricola]
MAAVSRGVLFEVCYGQLLQNNTTPGGGAAAGSTTIDHQQRARANFIANMMELVRATKGRGIVISSECRLGTGAAAVAAAAAAGWNLRAPADLVNLFACWGLGPERGLEALGANPRAVVVNEGLRKRSYRGVVDIVDAEGKIPGQLKRQTNTTTESGRQDGQVSGKQAGKKNNNSNKNQQQQQQQQQGGGGNAKRKHDGGGEQGAKDQTLPVLSKRQAKKMKLAGK